MFSNTMFNKRLPSFYFKKSRHVSRKIVHRKITSAQCNKTFQSEVMSYFENSEDNSPKLSKEPLLKNRKIQMYRDDFPKLHNVSIRLSIGDVSGKLEKIFVIFGKISKTVDPEIKKAYLDDIDIRCFSIVNYLQPSEILKLVHLYFKVIPSEIKASYFFEKALGNLVNFAENLLLSAHETIQLLWFISLCGCKYGNYMNDLRPYVPEVESLPLMEKCILIQSFYNTSMRLKPQQTRTIVDSLGKDFKQLISNPNYLIILCKALIISETNLDLSLGNLSTNILNLEEPIDFLTATYLLNLYAISRIYEEKATEKLAKQSIGRLKEDMIEKKFSIPLMHLEKFLWSISFLGIYLTLNEKTVIMPYLEQRYAEFRTSKDNVAYLLNCLVSSIMLRCWSTKLLRQCLEDRVFDQFFQKGSYSKIQPQVQLLLTLLSTEVKMLHFIPKKYETEIHHPLTVSEYINIVLDVADDLAKRNLIRYVAVEYPINSIAIPGVTFSSEKETYHIDILDDSTCFKDTRLIYGLTNLKFRLLSRLGYRHIKLDRNLFNEDLKETKFNIEKVIVNRITYRAEDFNQNKTTQ